MNKKGFTLIELLVVIAIIALLLAVILPALKSAKAQAQGAVCLAHLNSLTKCWMLYAQENDEQLVGNMVGSTAAPSYCWVQGKLDTAGNPVASANGTWEDEVRGLAKGLLGSYTNEPFITVRATNALLKHQKPAGRAMAVIVPIHWSTAPESPPRAKSITGVLNLIRSFLQFGRQGTSTFW